MFAAQAIAGDMEATEPYAWLKATLEAIATGHPNDRIGELLPWKLERLSS